MHKTEVTTVYLNKESEAQKSVILSPKEVSRLKKRHRLYEFINSLKAGVVFVVILFVFFVRGINVEGPSMQPTFDSGDFVLASSVFYEVERGDVIVISPYNSLEQSIIKRVIAVEGDVVDIDFKEHKVYLNGKELDEPYIGALTARKFDVEFPVTVPKGCYFVLGDNRNDSLDSRSSEVGFVKSEMVFGEVIFKLIPFEIGGIS